MSHPIDADVRLLAALADPVRLDIVRELAVSRQTCACDLTECCEVSQPTVSHHLKVLREAGAVVSERRGSNIYYRLAPNLGERLGGIASGLVAGVAGAPGPDDAATGDAATDAPGTVLGTSPDGGSASAEPRG